LVPVNLPRPRVAPHYTSPRRISSWGGCAAAVSPPPLTGAISGHTTATSQPLVSPIVHLRRLFISSGHCSPPASSPPPEGNGSEYLGVWLWTRDLFIMKVILVSLQLSPAT
jgi:hypothetical protein